LGPPGDDVPPGPHWGPFNQMGGPVAGRSPVLLSRFRGGDEGRFPSQDGFFGLLFPADGKAVGYGGNRG